MKRHGPAALALGILAAPSSSIAQTNLTQYVALGDSYTAGVVSNALVETHQVYSIPSLLARQAGATNFEQPLVSEPGIPAELVVVSLVPTAVIAPKASTPGALRNGSLPRAYNNLGIPNTTAADLLARTGDAGGTHDLILRGRGAAVSQALSLQPTFVTLWVGTDEVLGSVLRGGVGGLPEVSTFRAAYEELVGILKAAGVSVMAGNLLDPTSFPFATTLPPFVVDPATGEPVRVEGRTVPLLGPSGPLAGDTLVTLVASSLVAQGIGVPEAQGGRGTPLPGEVVIDVGEAEAIRARVEALNRVIGEVCQAAAVPVVDLNGFYSQLAAGGRRIGGITISNRFLTGGFFSYDGVHPTDLGYALLANEWIGAVNRAGGSLPLLDLSPFLGVTAQASRSRLPSSFELSWESAAGILELYAHRP